MTFDPTKPVQTRGGLPARIICTDAKGGDPIFALVLERGIESAHRFAADGLFWSNKNACDDDLINIPDRIEEWANVYEGGLGPWYTRKAEPIHISSDPYLFTLHRVREGKKVISLKVVDLANEVKL